MQEGRTQDLPLTSFWSAMVTALHRARGRDQQEGSPGSSGRGWSGMERDGGAAMLVPELVLCGGESPCTMLIHPAHPALAPAWGLDRDAVGHARQLRQALSCAVLCCAVLRRAASCCAVLRRAVLRRTELSCAGSHVHSPCAPRPRSLLQVPQRPSRGGNAPAERHERACRRASGSMPTAWPPSCWRHGRDGTTGGGAEPHQQPHKERHWKHQQGDHGAPGCGAGGRGGKGHASTAGARGGAAGSSTPAKYAESIITSKPRNSHG